LIRTTVDVSELIAWELDEYPYRNLAINHVQEIFENKIERAKQRLAERERHANCSALLEEETKNIQHLFAAHARSTELQNEYEGLDWTLGVVDLRRLLAFQRRLILSSTHSPSPVPKQDEWHELTSFAIGSRRTTEHRVIRHCDTTDGLEITLQSNNPDLQLRTNTATSLEESSSFFLYGGAPSFEVAEYRGRWFLRDGYHRAHRLLRAGVHRIPAVVIYARTLKELGATKPWFFGENQLLSDRPPLVTDFLDETLVLRYERPALRKVIRIRIQESLEPFDETSDVQGEII
jgi:hypothetical protein